jgi:8-oxo-dGTP diphosphatase
MAKKYKNPAATATIIAERARKILFVRRKYAPYKGRLALPGGFLNYGKETLERTGQRELKEETGLRTKQSRLYLICVHSSPRRDSRGHVIDHVYAAPDTSGEPDAKDDAIEYVWREIYDIPKRLAFDHNKAVRKYLKWRADNYD